MRFISKLVTSLPVIAGICCTTSAAAVRRAVDSDSLVKNLQVLTTQSQDLTTTLEKATEEEKNYPYVQNRVVGDLAILTQQTHDDDADMEGTQAFADETAQQQVCDAYNTLVTTQQATMDALVRKSFFRYTNAGGPIDTWLQELEKAEDSLGSKLISAVPFCADAAIEDKKNLGTAVKKALCVYSFGHNC